MKKYKYVDNLNNIEKTAFIDDNVIIGKNNYIGHISCKKSEFVFN